MGLLDGITQEKEYGIGKSNIFNNDKTMKIIKTINESNLIIVEIPKEFYNYEIEARGNLLVDGAIYLLYAKTPNGKNDWNRDIVLNDKPYNEDKYKLLGKLSELLEEECTTLVKSFISNWNIPNVHFDFLNFKWENIDVDINNYSVNKLFPFETAKESLISLLQSNDIDTSKEDELLLIKKL